MQVIIFLYLLDNDTSYVVLFSSGLGLLIEFWKVTKAMSVSVTWVNNMPRLTIGDKAGYACAPPSQSPCCVALPNLLRSLLVIALEL